MAYQEIDVAKAGAVATLTLNRPEVLNAITPRMLEEAVDAFTAFRSDGSIRVVVLTGRGRAFSAGVDLKSLNGQPVRDGAVGASLDRPARRLIELMGETGYVVVAAVNGFCFTGALEIALAADIVVAAEDALFADTHAKFGLRPSWGMSQRLPHAVGLPRARLLSYTARRFTGRQAEQWGLAALACPNADLPTVVDDLAASIIDNSVGSVRAYKALFQGYQSRIVAEGLVDEAAAHFEIPDTEDRIRGFR
ncbi:enoyl-CoA hydratase/isomerase family protein [Frankia sp. CN7]|nr:enoyl-CoA hydratase/isomerase family protein [Frankia nepalensis]